MSCCPRGPTQVKKGDVLKLYDAASKVELGRVVLSADPEPLPDAPAPKGWAATQWQARVHPDAVFLWRVAFAGCTTASGAAADCPAVADLSAVVQIDRLASAGAVIVNSHFHDSYNNFGRFAASDLLFKGNKVERCQDGAQQNFPSGILCTQ
jgi:hypothetical protein